MSALARSTACCLLSLSISLAGKFDAKAKWTFVSPLASLEFFHYRQILSTGSVFAVYGSISSSSTNSGTGTFEHIVAHFCCFCAQFRKARLCGGRKKEKNPSKMAARYAGGGGWWSYTNSKDILIQRVTFKTTDNCHCCCCIGACSVRMQSQSVNQDIRKRHSTAVPVNDRHRR